MGAIIDNPTAAFSNGLTDLQLLADRDTKISKGLAQVSLSTYSDGSTAPIIQAGSVYEVNGSYFLESANQTPAGWSGISNSTQAYLKVTVTGSGNSSTTAWSYTSTAPTWSDAKQGWYNSNDRYLFKVYKGGTGNYTEISFIFDVNIANSYDSQVSTEYINSAGVQSRVLTRTRVYELGVWNMDSTSSLSVPHLLSDYTKIRSIDVMIKADEGESASGGTRLIPLSTGGTIQGVQNPPYDSIYLIRVSSGGFDSTEFNSTTQNRGWIYITYED